MLNLDEKNKKIHDAFEIQYKIKGKSGISGNNLHLKEQRKNLLNPSPKNLLFQKKLNNKYFTIEYLNLHNF